MNKLGIRKAILAEVFPDHIFQEGKNEFITFCPKGCHATKRKLQINIQKNVGQCWSCGDSGPALYFIKKYGNKNQRKRYAETLDLVVRQDDFEDFTLEYPEGYRFLLDVKNTPLGKMAYQYIKEELMIPDEVVLQNRIGICSSGQYGNRIIFTSYDEQGKFNYFLGRTLIDSGKKYLDCSIEKRKVVFNELYINWFKPLILVEGVKTHLKHWSVSNVVPMNGSPIITATHKIYYDIVVNGVKEVFIGFDKEAYMKSLETMNRLLAAGVSVKFIDFNKQPDELSTEDFLAAIGKAKRFSGMDYLTERVRAL